MESIYYIHLYLILRKFQWMKKVGGWKVSDAGGLRLSRLCFIDAYGR